MKTEDPLITEWEWSNYTSRLKQLTLNIYNLTKAYKTRLTKYKYFFMEWGHSLGSFIFLYCLIFFSLIPLKVSPIVI